MLISAPLDKNESALPSPDQLKRKILLKHKKLPDGADEILQKFEPSGTKQDFDIASSVKNGILYVRDRWVAEILTWGIKISMFLSIKWMCCSFLWIEIWVFKVNFLMSKITFNSSKDDFF